MFEEFLTQYIKDLIDCGDSEYDINEDEIRDVMLDVEGNEYVWEVLDEAIYQELDKYRKEDK